MAQAPAFPGQLPFDVGGMPNTVWLQFLLFLYNQIGGASGSPSILLDQFTVTPGSLLIRDSSAWEGLAPGAQYTALRISPTTNLPEWSILDGNSFDPDANTVFAGPVSGPHGVAIWRKLVAADLPAIDTSTIFGPQLAGFFLGGPQAGVPLPPTFRALQNSDIPPSILPAGQFPGTTTDDDAAAGNVGEYIASSAPNGSQTVTISHASPAVVAWNTHGMNVGSPVNFTTTGGLPSGLTVGTTYYVCSTLLTPNSFTVAGSIADAFAGNALNTTTAGTPTHTAYGNAVLTSTFAIDITAISLTAGDWDVWANLAVTGALTSSSGWISTSSITDPSAPNQGAYVSWTTQLAMPVGMRRLSLSAPTTAYLSMLPTFGGTSNGFGFLAARRAR